MRRSLDLGWGLRRRRWLVLAVVLGVGGTVLLAGGEPEAREWQRVERRDLVLSVDMTGELKAVRSTVYGPPPNRQIWNFRIASMIPEGATVEAGDPILAFDTSELQQRLLRTTAQRDSAQKSLEKRQTDLEVEREGQKLSLAEAEARARRATLKTDVPEDLVARHELRIAQIDRRIADTEVEYRRGRLESLDQSREAELGAFRQRRDRAQAQVEEIEAQIEQMSIRALGPGTVIYSTNRGGEKKKVGDPCWRNEQVLEIPDLSLMRVEAEVDEVELGRLRLGQKAELYLDAHVETAYPATLATIHNTVERSSWRDPRKRVRIELDLAETDTKRMRPGMRLKGNIEIERIPDVLSVPLAAVVPGPDGPAVVVKTAFGSRRVRPRLGRRDGEWVEVTAGLTEGDRVLVGG